MTTLPDFTDWTPEQLAAWVDEHGFKEIIRASEPGTTRFIFLPTPEEEAAAGEVPTRVTSVRLPAPMIDELEQFKHLDRDGRSGLIRVAVERYLKELRAGEAA